MNFPEQTDVLVLGGGLAGLSAAWEAARRGCSVTLVVRAAGPSESNTYHAQGGIIYRAPGEDRELLVDDILDTGRTLKRVSEKLLALKPRSLKTCVLLDKKARRVEPIDWSA